MPETQREQHTFVGTDAAAARLKELRSRPGMAEQVAEIRSEMDTADDVEDAIDRWHDTGGAPDGHPVELHEYLGMTDEQHGKWMIGAIPTDPRVISLREPHDA